MFDPLFILIFFVLNSRQFVGIIRWDLKSHRKITTDTRGKNTGIFTSICRGTASHNVYVTDNSSKLKIVQYNLLQGSVSVLLCITCCRVV